MTEPQRNWAGNLTYSAARIATPSAINDLAAEAAMSARARALGSRHSFNAIADTEATLISTAGLAGIINLDVGNRTVTVEAGITYGQLCPHLDQAGFALHNLASLPHISVVGACMTGTHGSGEANGNLATAVRALEFVTAEGTFAARSREHDPDEFAGLVVGLGGYGVVVRATLDLLPRFAVRQVVYRDLPLDTVEAQFDAIQAAGYSVSLFTRWEAGVCEQVWVKALADAGPLPDELFGARASAIPLNPLGEQYAERCTPQFGVPGPWHERLPHFRMEFTPSHGEELQSEYFVPRAQAVEALQAVRALSAEVAPLLYISEIRCIAADDLWMSPAYGRDSVGIHFTWQPRWGEVSRVLPRIEAALAPFAPRPHWGKLFTMPPVQVQKTYPRLDDFRALLRRYDPAGKFRNRFLEAYIFG